jgi:hypothetical protein
MDAIELEETILSLFFDICVSLIGHLWFHKMGGVTHQTNGLSCDRSSGPEGPLLSEYQFQVHIPAPKKEKKILVQ